MKTAFALLLASVTLLTAATTNWVETTGNDSTGDGSQGNPWKTLDKAFSRIGLTGGDWIIMGSGVFTNDANTDFDGSAGNPITVQGAGTNATVIYQANVIIDKAYYHIKDFTIDGGYLGNYLMLDSGNCHDILVENVEILRSISPINSDDSGSSDYAYNVTLRNLRIHHPVGNGMVECLGSNWVLELSTFHNNNGNDVLRWFGPSGIIRSNRFLAIESPEVTGWTNLSTTSLSVGTGVKSFTTASGMKWTRFDQLTIFSAADPTKTMTGFVTNYIGTALDVDVYSTGGSGSASDWVIEMTSDGNHADIIQTFNTSSTTDWCTNLLFEANFATNCTAQLGNVDHDAANSLSGDWTFRNNIFWNCRNQFNCYLPGVKFYNNTFFNSSNWTTGLKFDYTASNRGAAHSAWVVNNLFIRCDGIEAGDGFAAWNASCTNKWEDFNVITDLGDGSFSSYSAGANSINGGYTPTQIFVDPWNGNFQITNTFTAGIGGGTNLLAFVPADFTGESRTSTFDIGALIDGNSNLSGGGGGYTPTIVTNNASGARVSGFRNLAMAVVPRNLTTATDTFDRIDEDPLATTMSDGVSTWSVGPGNWENLEIVSNEAVNANIAASSGAAAVATSPTFSANQSVSIVLGSTVGGQILIVRGDSLLEAGYAVGIDDSDTIVFSQLFSGSHMSLSTLSVVNGLSLSAGETVTLTVTGSGPVELKAYNDGVEIGSYTDSSGVVTGGQPGVAVWENSLDGGIASWSATDL